ncbi:MAG TPA: hypothetical protein VGS27_33705 [Candidatus Sulfotelmatobacter sp.]|nr:hypothetical protein [Candidatus Sulfotelmatobacter sp.]
MTSPAFYLRCDKLQPTNCEASVLRKANPAPQSGTDKLPDTHSLLVYGYFELGIRMREDKHRQIRFRHRKGLRVMNHPGMILTRLSIAGDLPEQPAAFNVAVFSVPFLRFFKRLRCELNLKDQSMTALSRKDICPPTISVKL